MAGRIAAIVVGSGISGAIVFNPDARATLGDFIGGGKQSTSAGSDLSAVRELVSNVEKLSDAYKGSGGMPPTVTVIDAGGGGGGGDLRLALIGAGLSAVSIMSLLLYFKGKMLTNLLWISKKNFGTTLNKVHDNIEALTAHMQSLRNELTTKIFTVEDKVKLSAEQIHEKVDAEVGFAKKRINVVGMSVEEVQHIVDGLERRLDELQAKVTYANKGILLLCSVVGSLPQQERKSTGLWEELRRFVSGRPEVVGLELPNSQRPTTSNTMQMGAMRPKPSTSVGQTRSASCKISDIRSSFADGPSSSGVIHNYGNHDRGGSKSFASTSRASSMHDVPPMEDRSHASPRRSASARGLGFVLQQ